MQPKPVVHKDHLIWIDLEMTGLNPDTDVIIEIATIVTDSDLTVLAEGPSTRAMPRAGRATSRFIRR